MKKRGALFYIIDAFIAAGIIAITISIVLSSYLNAPSPDNTKQTLDNYFNFFENTPIALAPCPAPGPCTATTLLEDGTLGDPQVRMINVIAELAARGDAASLTNAQNIISEATEVTLASQYGAAFILNPGVGETSLYDRNLARKTEASISFSKRIIISSVEPARMLEKNLYYNTGNRVRGETACQAEPLPTGYTPPLRWECANLQSPDDNFYLPEDCGINILLTHDTTVHCILTINEALVGPNVIEVSIWP